MMARCIRPASVVLGLLALAQSARGGGPTIDATQYLPLGAFNAWEMIDKATWNEGLGVDDGQGGTLLKAGHQVILVTKTDVVAGVPRYNIRTKLFQDVQDVLFQVGVDGDTLYLYGVRVLVPEDIVDDDDFDVKLPTVFFDEPVPIGDTSTSLGGIYSITPVSASFDVKIEFGPLDESGKVFLGPGSTVVASWLPAGEAVQTPLGPFAEGAPTLARLQLDFFFTYSSNNADIHDEIGDEVTDKSVSALLGPGIGFVEIDGVGQQKKIVNRAILPGQLLFDPEADDALPLPPPGDPLGFVTPAPGIVSLSGALPAEGTSVTDTVVLLDELAIEHDLSGALRLRASAFAGEDEAELLLSGRTKPNPKTGGLKVALKGQTKKLPSFAKKVAFTVKQELSLGEGGEGGPTLEIVYNAGKDPVTKEPISGTLFLPVAPFVANTAALSFAPPVDVPKVKKNVLQVNPAKRRLGAEGSLILFDIGEGDGATFPITLLEQVKVKEGLPTLRSYTVTQTGTKAKLFKARATTDPLFDLQKFSGRLSGVKITPSPADVTPLFP